jgi:hypothetical protein
MNRSTRRIVPLAALCLAALAGATAAMAQTPVGTAFTYQGQLKVNGAIYTGSADFNFRVFDAQTAGNLIRIGNTVNNAQVAGGVFTVDVDVADVPFTTNQARWLEIGVRSPSGNGPFVVLPRVRLAPTPFSLATRGINVDAIGRVGIGTTTPNANLVVDQPTNALALVAIDSGQTAIEYSAVDFRDRGVPKWGMGKDNANNFYIDQSTVGRVLLVDPAQNVAFGSSAIANPFGFSRVLTVDGNPSAGAAPGSVAVMINNPVAGSDWAIGSASDGGLRFSHTGTGTDRVKVPVLEIYGGSDIAEPYSVAPASNIKPEPGMVVAIDPGQVGKLRVASAAYDRTVAGIISGANGVNTGLTLTQKGSVADGQLPVASIGRVWCLVDADAGGAVQAGDRLTTSATPGHAMKASDTGRAQGAVLGKAMSSLDHGKGLVLVLVGLQ